MTNPTRRRATALIAAAPIALAATSARAATHAVTISNRKIPPGYHHDQGRRYGDLDQSRRPRPHRHCQG